jgi:hypothetical protein
MHRAQTSGVVRARQSRQALNRVHASWITESSGTGWWPNVSAHGFNSAA